MAKYEMMIVVDIDEVALGNHNGNLSPPPNNVKDWYVSDLFLAYQKGWISEDWNNEAVEFVTRLESPSEG